MWKNYTHSIHVQTNSVQKNSKKHACNEGLYLLAGKVFSVIECVFYKVHGGITEDNIKQFIKKAEDFAKINEKKGLDTCVFFDEANTTDAIGLIKEVLCDRTLCGNPVSHSLKFIAACNPYKK